LKHFTSPKFWAAYNALPEQVRHQADDAYALLKQNPSHPSLHFKKTGAYWSVRVSIRHRALALAEGDDFVWFWIGTHKEYERLIK
jgi:hypothetical protein